MKQNIIVITGASSGMGKEFARVLDSKMNTIDEFWLIARDLEKLTEISAQLKHKSRIIIADITEKDQLLPFQKMLSSVSPVIRMLINCAGYGIMGDVSLCFNDPGRMSEQLGMVTCNCEALTHVTLSCLPYMKANSRILQLASAAAFIPQPGFAVYAASKSYVLHFSLALREELKKRRIRVTAVCPGPVNTPFLENAQKYEKSPAFKKLITVSPEKVVRKALKDSADSKAVSVCGIPAGLLHTASAVIPDAIFLKIQSIMKH